MQEILKVNKLQKNFYTYHLGKKIKAVNNISFSVNEGEFLGIIGKSGAGKSTIIKCIYRTYLPSSGEIIYRTKNNKLVNLANAHEQEISYYRIYEIAYVSQFLQIIPRTTALEIVINSMLELGEQYDDAYNMACEVLTFFKIKRDLWNAYPNTFSGGEKLRLNLARAIVKQPRLLLLDEPTASLDDDSKEKVFEILNNLNNKGTTIIGIFHDLEFIEKLASNIIDINNLSVH